MRLNTLAPKPNSQIKAKRLGRGPGSGLGKTSGKGHKGLKARSGGRVPIGFEGGQMPLVRRIPKYGFRSHLERETAKLRSSVLNSINADVVTFDVLVKNNLVNHNIKYIKIYLSGDITKPLTLKGILVTKGVKAQIEKLGGKVEE